MRSGNPACILNPKAARTLERKGIAAFKDIWSVENQEWGLETERWHTLSITKKVLLNQVFQDIKESWPTSHSVSTEPSLKHWEFKGGTRRDTPLDPGLLGQ